MRQNYDFLFFWGRETLNCAPGIFGNVRKICQRFCAEWEERQNRRNQYLLNNARFRQSTALEQIDFSANRQGLNKANVLQLASCNFIKRSECHSERSEEPNKRQRFLTSVRNDKRTA
ncbi:MAG: ATP-binding protein [Saprospiraceae bacterium]